MLAVLLFAVLAVWGCAHGGRAILRGFLKVKRLSRWAQAASYLIGGAMGVVVIAYIYGDGPEALAWFMGVSSCIPLTIMGVLTSLETWKDTGPRDEPGPVP
jgi:Na+-driven multidrug efflux pump